MIKKFTKKVYSKILTFLIKMLIVFLLVSIGGVLFYRYIPIPYTPFMAIKSLKTFYGKDSKGGTFLIDKKWVPIEKMDKAILRSVIKAEDAKFYTHNGFDFEAIQKALKYNSTHKKQKGASTISQQTAKNVFLWPSRSWMRKGLEVYFTVLIEMFWSKTRIMEVYLNVIELGPGVYGVEAASLKYFHKSAQHLGRGEAALIAAVLPNPIKFKINRPSAYIIGRQQRIIGKKPMPAPTADSKKETMTEAEAKEFFDLKFDNDEEAAEEAAEAAEAD